jgi:NADH-quinone oxidoreductase subunit M
MLIWHWFDSSISALQFEQWHPWIPSVGVDYHVGIDGLGLLMLLLSAVVVVIGIAASVDIKQRDRVYFALIFILESCLFGAFTALNFVHWFTYWELSLIPAFFLIKLWGGPHRTTAATQFLVYTMAGSIAMLLGFLALFTSVGTFDFIELAQLSERGRLMPAVINGLHLWNLSPQHMTLLVFAAVFMGFAVKVPLVPFHTWLPSAYAEAPTGATILLTGAMSKMGLYGFLRILLPIFGAEMQRYLTPLLWLAIASVVLSAFAALGQTELKRIFAYSSINHLGYCVLGIFAAAKLTGDAPDILLQKWSAISGVLLQMFNHGVTAATIFWFIALLELRNSGKAKIDDFGGIRKVAPILTGMMGIALFSSLGLSALNGFVGEFLIFKGSFPLVPWATSLCVMGLFVTAVFILGVLQRVFTGPLNPNCAGFPDLTSREQLVIVPVVGLMFVLGLYPQLLLGVINTSVLHLVQQIKI